MRSRQTIVCENNLRQINMAIRMYCDDAQDLTPNTQNAAEVTNVPWVGYKELMKSYVGLRGPSAPGDAIFACPADRFYYDWKAGYAGQRHCDQAAFDYSSYTLNAVNLRTNVYNPFTGNDIWPGVGGRRLSTIRNPARTILVAEAPAFFPYSWHDPKPALPRGTTPTWNPGFNNAKDAVSFADGHGSYIRMYWSPEIICSCFQDPPARYDYQWSGD